MFKMSAKMSAALAVITVLVLVCLQSLEANASKLSGLSPLNQSTIVATASAPPSLGTSILGGKQVYVLYMTRPGDTVLVRCYPGYQPTMTVRAMGSNPGGVGQKEGFMTCKSGA